MRSSAVSLSHHGPVSYPLYEEVFIFRPPSLCFSSPVAFFNLCPLSLLAFMVRDKRLFEFYLLWIYFFSWLKCLVVVCMDFLLFWSRLLSNFSPFRQSLFVQAKALWSSQVLLLRAQIGSDYQRQILLIFLSEHCQARGRRVITVWPANLSGSHFDVTLLFCTGVWWIMCPC